MTIRKATIEGREFIVLLMGKSTDEEVLVFAGRYLSYIRSEDHVACLNEDGDDKFPIVYAAPWRGDMLIKPADNPGACPLLVNGKTDWARKVFGGE